MISTLKYSWASFQDSSKSNEIVSKSTGSALWFFIKISLISSLLLLVSALVFLVYNVPQIPGLISKNFPDARFQMQNGKFSSTLPQPIISTSEGSTFVFDTTASASSIQAYESAVLITSDGIYSKEGSNTRSMSFSEVPDFNVSKSDVVSLAQQNIWIIFAFALVVSLLLILLITVVNIISGIIFLALYSVLLLVVSKVLKKNLNYSQGLSLSFYAASLPVLINTFTTFFPNIYLTVSIMILFVYVSISFIRALSLQQVVTSPATRVTKTPKSKSKKSTR